MNRLTDSVLLESVTVIGFDDHENGTKENAPKCGLSPKEKPIDRVSKILFLDGVRGLAAILVVTQHSNFMGDLNFGACAVDIFFVLSSFLLTMSFEKHSRKMIEQHASSRKWFFTLVDYFSKRFFRVYPLFAVTAIALWLMPSEFKTKYYKISNPDEYDLFKVLLFYTPYRYHGFWTLPVEIGYYFFIPVFVLIIIWLDQQWWILCVPLYTWILYIGMFVYRTSHAPLYMHLTTFLAGSLAAIIYSKADFHIRRNNFQFNWWHTFELRALEGVAIALFCSVGFRGLFFHWIHENPVPDAKGFPFVSVLATIVMVIEMLLPSEVSKIFEWNVLRYSGKISFSMYLLHSFVIYDIHIIEQPYYDRFVGQFILVYLLSTISYYLVEYPTQVISAKISKMLLNRIMLKSS